MIPPDATEIKNGNLLNVGRMIARRFPERFMVMYSGEVTRVSPFGAGWGKSDGATFQTFDRLHKTFRVSFRSRHGYTQWTQKFVKFEDFLAFNNKQFNIDYGDENLVLWKLMFK